MKPIRIGNGCGFWGDHPDAPIRLARDGHLDYLTLEYLAELTMSILALQKQRDPSRGYATDFVDLIEPLAAVMQQQPSLKLVTNAGGMNPRGCAEQVRERLKHAGLSESRVAVVTGDDLVSRLDELLATGHHLYHLDSGEPLDSIRDRVVSVNAYLGAEPIRQALAGGANVVITGRVADAALTLGPLTYEFGWGFSTADLDRLAAGTVAGHLIECGAQVTGGIWTGAEAATHLETVGYPIVEVDHEGRFVITKPQGSGGVVNFQTVAEQLLYEVEDPAEYYTPDVVADFTTPILREIGRDRVLVEGCLGKPPTATYKVSIAYRDGWTAAGTLVISGPHAVNKARLSGEIILDRLRQAGFTPEESLVELLGAGALLPGQAPAVDPPEVVLRVAVRDRSRAVVERFTREFAPLVTSGLPGTTGYTTGRPAVREVFAFWPALIAKSAVTPKVELLE